MGSGTPAATSAIATGRPGPDVLDVDQHGTAGTGFAAWNAGQARGPGRAAARDRPHAQRRHARLLRRDRPAVSDDPPAATSISGPPAATCVAPHSTVGGKPLRRGQRQPSAATVDFGAVRQLVDPQRERPAGSRRSTCATAAQNLDHLVAQMAGQPEGNRNGFLHWAANRVLDHGQDERLTELANAAVAAGLPRREADRTIDLRPATATPGPARHPTTARPGPADPPRANRSPPRARGRPRPPGGSKSHPPASRS